MANTITVKDFLKSKVRLFVNHTRDAYFTKYYSAEAWYTISLLIDKCKKKLTDFRITTIQPFPEIFNNLQDVILSYTEDYFIIYLENYFHSNEYYYHYIKHLLNIMKKNWISDKKIIIQSYKISKEEAKDLLEEHNNVKAVLRTDMDYFLNEFLYKKTDLSNISNILYKDKDWKVITTDDNVIKSSLEDYTIWCYYNWYLETLQDEALEKTLFMDESRKKIYYDGLRRPTALLCTWKWCIYNCIYCFRAAKYNVLRQIPVDIIKKDLDYLQENKYKNIYLYDDCFLTTNANRIDEILELFNKYDMNFQIAMRYEMAFRWDFLQKLINSNIDKIQIWVQSINQDTNKLIWRAIDLEKFQQIFDAFKKKWKMIWLDLILWLPGETLKDFINTFNYVVKLKPAAIYINTLFLNPNTELYNNREKYWVEYSHESKTNKFRHFHSVPLIKQSTSFPSKDIDLARKYIDKVIKLNKDILIISR